MIIFQESQQAFWPYPIMFDHTGKALSYLASLSMLNNKSICLWWRQTLIIISLVHRHLSNIDFLSFVMCPLLVPVKLVNRLLFFFFFFCCGCLQNYWNKQGRRYAPLSSLYFLDVYGLALQHRALCSLMCCIWKYLLSCWYVDTCLTKLRGMTLYNGVRCFWHHQMFRCSTFSQLNVPFKHYV